MAKTIGQLTSATTIGNGDLFVIEQSSQTKKVAASVVRGGLVNADIDAAAAIALSKLATGALPSGITVASANLVDGTIAAADIASDAVTTAKILDANVTTGKVADAAITPAKLSQPFTLATSQASTSGTSIDFTGIPSWAKRITVMFDGVSTSGVSLPIIQIGDSGGFETSGYTGGAVIIGTGAASSSLTSGFLVYDNSASATNTLSGSAVLSNIAGSSWAVSGMFGDGVNAHISAVAGTKSLSDTLTQVRITTVNGADTFDAGTINISYEG